MKDFGPSLRYVEVFQRDHRTAPWLGIKKYLDSNLAYAPQRQIWDNLVQTLWDNPSRKLVLAFRARNKELGRSR